MMIMMTVNMLTHKVDSSPMPLMFSSLFMMIMMIVMIMKVIMMSSPMPRMISSLLRSLQAPVRNSTTGFSHLRKVIRMWVKVQKIPIIGGGGIRPPEESDKNVGKSSENPIMGGGGVTPLRAPVRNSTKDFSHLIVIMLSSHDDHITITLLLRYPVIIIEENQPFQTTPLNTTLVPHVFLSWSNLDHMVTKVNCIWFHCNLNT